MLSASLRAVLAYALRYVPCYLLSMVKKFFVPTKGDRKKCSEKRFEPCFVVCHHPQHVSICSCSFQLMGGMQSDQDPVSSIMAMK
jgi:hypothetical protein